jgi:hypothetical protein
MITPAVYKKDNDGNRVLKSGRVRMRNQLGHSFKEWARDTFKRSQDLAPKLSKIISGAKK